MPKRLYFHLGWKGLSKPYTFKDYRHVVDILIEKHKKHTRKWLEKTDKEHYNLRSLQIRHVCSEDPDDIDGFINEYFLNYIDDYKSTLAVLYVQILQEIESQVGKSIIGRIKNDDSILFKLHRKRFEDGGKFSLNKYLNDLLGFRIIDENYKDNIDKLSLYLDELKEQGIRLIHRYRESRDYKGYHIYFMGANAKYFPMELQVWDSKNERTNLESHQLYKKEYTYWPKIYKNG